MPKNLGGICRFVNCWPFVDTSFLPRHYKLFARSPLQRVSGPILDPMSLAVPGKFPWLCGAGRDNATRGKEQ